MMMTMLLPRPLLPHRLLQPLVVVVAAAAVVVVGPSCA